MQNSKDKEEIKMDGFFERYGRMIVVAVAICFVLLYLTPMRNVVGSSINGFTGNFANKVGESLGTVQMPNGSGGTTSSEGAKVGSILKIEGTEYIVLEERENNQALVMTASSIGERMFQYAKRADGQARNTYEGSEIDNYLENEWYNSLSSTIKAAVQPTNIKQVSYKGYSDPDSKQDTGYNGQIYNTISRHAFLPSVSEIGKVVDLKNPEKTQELLNRIATWTRDSWSKYSSEAEYVSGKYGYNGLGSTDVLNYCDVCPTFVIDLSKVDYTVEGTTNYK